MSPTRRKGPSKMKSRKLQEAERIGTRRRTHTRKPEVCRYQDTRKPEARRHQEAWNVEDVCEDKETGCRAIYGRGQTSFFFTAMANP